MKQKIINLLHLFVFPGLILILFFGCKKLKSDLVFSEINSGTEKNLYNIFCLSDDTLFVCGGEHESGILLQSTDKGATWNTLSTDFIRPLYSVYFLNSSIGFAGADSGYVYNTKDGGKTWVQYMDYVGIPYQYRTPLHSVCFTDSVNGFFAGGSNFGRGIIYSTHDAGNSWSTTGFEHELRSVNYNGKHICAMGYGALLISENKKDFALTPCDNSYFTGQVFTSQSEGIACSYNGGLNKTTDGGLSFSDVKKANNAFSSREHYLCIDAKEERVISCGLSGIVSLSFDNGNSFENRYSFNDTRINAVKMLSNHKTIAVGSNGKIFMAEF